MTLTEVSFSRPKRTVRTAVGAVLVTALIGCAAGGWNAAAEALDGESSNEEAQQFEGFVDFLTPPDGDRWHVADSYAPSGRWIDTAWARRQIRQLRQGVEFTLEPRPSYEKNFTGAELQTFARPGYGRYEVVLKAAKGPGLVTAAFTYTGPYFGNRQDEIDFEFLGKDTTEVQLNTFYDGVSHHKTFVELGFDAAETPYLYAFEWGEGFVRFFVGDRMVHEITSEDGPVPSIPGGFYLQHWAGGPGTREWLGGAPEYRDSTANFYCASFRPLGSDKDQCSTYFEDGKLTPPKD